MPIKNKNKRAAWLPLVDNDVLRSATKKYVTHVLEEYLPAWRSAAKECGYALTVHGSLSRDIDLVAIPWTDSAVSPAILANSLLCEMKKPFDNRGVFLSWGAKPHGRIACTILLHGLSTEIDLSILTPSGANGLVP